MTIKELSNEIRITPRAIQGIIQRLGLSPKRYGQTIVLNAEEIKAIKMTYHPKAGQPKKVKKGKQEND